LKDKEEVKEGEVSVRQSGEFMKKLSQKVNGKQESYFSEKCQMKIDSLNK
jgi:hypothetical protein